MSREKNSSGFAVFIILIGVAVLLINLDVLRLDMFWGIIHLWPLLLVVGGLSILFRKIRHFDIVLWLVFFGIVIGYSYLNMDQKNWFVGEKIESKTFEKSLGEEKNAVLDLNISTGNITIDGTEEKDITYSVPEIGMKTISLDVNSNEPAILTLADKTASDFMTAFQQRYYDFKFPKDKTWTVDIDAAVIEANFDFSQIEIDQVKVDYSVGDVSVIIGEETYGNYDFNFAVGHLNIDVPDDMNVRIRYDGALSSMDYPDEYTRLDDYYYSENFDESKPFIDIIIDLAVGSVEIK